MQALKISLDRDQLIKAALGGYGTPSNDNPISSISPFWVDTGMKKRDVAKAKALMTEAGYGNGVDVELITTNERAGLVEFAVGVKEMSAPAGLSHRHQDGALRRLHRALQPQASVQHAELERSADDRRGAVSVLPLEGQLQGALSTTATRKSTSCSTMGARNATSRSARTCTDGCRRSSSESGPVVIPYHRPYMAALQQARAGLRDPSDPLGRRAQDVVEHDLKAPGRN